MNNGNNLQHGIVVFLDAVGITDIWERFEMEKVVEKWTQTERNFSCNIERLYEEVIKNHKITFDMLRFKAFSDTIIVTLEVDDPRNYIYPMAAYLEWAFCDAIIEGCVPLFFRGAISVGNFCQSDTIVIGPAVAEASKRHKYFDWFGISLAPTAHKAFNSVVCTEKYNDPIYKNKYLMEYDTPIRKCNDNGKEKAWVVSWPNELCQREGDDIARQKVVQAFDRWNWKELESKLKSRYQNTLDFFDHCCSSQ